jgi:hypothetical protein
MSDPRATLTTLRNRLRPGGAIVIRVPVADSDAAEMYGSDWVQLDAPRHLIVPTDAGMQAVADACGLTLTRTFRDSTAFQFWGSEQYRRGIPLHDPRGYGHPGGEQLFPPAQIAAWEQAAIDLNARGRGDSAGYVLTPRLHARTRIGLGRTAGLCV